MDTWMGDNHDPVTLHKYLYGNADPVTYTDPTGNFSIGGMMSSINVTGTLSRTAVSGVGFGLGFGFGDGVVNNGVFHSYSTESTICTKSRAVNDPCTFENVFYGLRLFPAPGTLGIDPVYTGKKSVVTFLGSVEHEVTSNAVVNQTLSDHLLHDGLVRRTVRVSGNSIRIETYGEGTGRFPLLNSLFSDVLWQSWDRRISNHVGAPR